jgi:hypothetical protein
MKVRFGLKRRVFVFSCWFQVPSFHISVLNAKIIHVLRLVRRRLCQLVRKLRLFLLMKKSAQLVVLASKLVQATFHIFTLLKRRFLSATCATASLNALKFAKKAVGERLRLFLKADGAQSTESIHVSPKT